MWLGDDGIKPCRLSLPFAPFDGKEFSNQTDDDDDDDDDVYSLLLVLHPHPHPIPARSIPPTPTPSLYQQQSIC